MTEYMTTRELAELLRIKERKVYDLAASGQVPCSKVMGKLLFPRTEIDAWIATGNTGPATAVPNAIRPNVILGSHDPLLEWALRESRSGLAAYFDGSTDGLNRFAATEGLAAGLHLYDPAAASGSEGANWNITQVKSQFGDQPVVLVEWAKRRRGLIINASHKGQVRGLNDLPGLRFAARQPEAGAQQLLVDLLHQIGFAPEDIQSTAVLRTETDAALAVLEGKADVSFGLEALAAQYQLDFVPIIEERYDLLVDRRAWFEPPLQELMRFCTSQPFKLRAAECTGYDLSGFGRVHFNGP